MKFRRSERLIDMTSYLLGHPRELISLSFFADRYGAAKSSISEDLAIIKETLEQQGIGTLKTIPGAAGGVKFYVKVSEKEARQYVGELCSMMENPERLLPGGYLYISDILGCPALMNKAGRLFASYFAETEIDVVMTIATKGITLGYAVAGQLNVPVVIVRNDTRVTEGSTVSINYVSGSTKKIQTMLLSRRSLKEGSKVLIVDDFMRAGGTVNGMVSLLKEFNCELAGIAVLVEADQIAERLVDDYLSVIKLSDVDVKKQKITVREGNYFKKAYA